MNTQPSDPGIDISVICPVGRYVGDLPAVHREFSEVLAASGRRVEFLYVLEGSRERAVKAVGNISENHHRLRLYRMARGFGESSALQFAFGRARGRYILTIPDRFQADPSAVPEILRALDRGVDVVVTRREPRQDALLNRLQSRAFHALVRRLSGQHFHDVTCGLRGMTREAAQKLDLYGDLHRFIPILATRLGFQVVEVPVRQRREDRALRLFGPGIYARRLLDILNVFFLTRFLRKPLRFFGLVGMALGSLGFAICAMLAAGKLFFGMGLADRPLLILGVLLLVLGVQVTSIGLIGEIVIFLSSRHVPPEVTEMEKNSD
ncbi:MAG: glycosyltransferase [Acidobacteriota bacterium]